jgi:organizing structure protein 2
MYGSPQSAPTTPKSGITDPLTNTPPSVPEASVPTPTDRLEVQIKHVRLWLHDRAVGAEKQFNSGLTWAFRKETDFTNTIASLAPAAETGEQLLPGLIYVLVATMAGSIVSRNRNILIRAAFPLAVGVTAGKYHMAYMGENGWLTFTGWMLIPVTMRNTGDLIWEYEKKVPAIAETHSTIAGFERESYRQLRDRSQGTIEWADVKATDTRKKVEELVKEGR